MLAFKPKAITAPWGKQIILYRGANSMAPLLSLDESVSASRLDVSIFEIKQALPRTVTRSLAFHASFIPNATHDKIWVVLSAANNTYAEFGYNTHEKSWVGEQVKLENQVKQLQVLQIPGGLTHAINGTARIIEISQILNIAAGLEHLPLLAAAKAALATKPWIAKPLANYDNTYSLHTAVLIFGQGPTQILAKCLVLDLDQLVIFEAEAEVVTLASFLIISLPKTRQ